MAGRDPHTTSRSHRLEDSHSTAAAAAAVEVVRHNSSSQCLSEVGLPLSSTEPTVLLARVVAAVEAEVEVGARTLSTVEEAGEAEGATALSACLLLPV